MRKLAILIVMGLFFVTTQISAQEVIAVGGYGYNKTEQNFHENGNYYFGEGRLMIRTSSESNFRVGPYVGYVGYGSQNPASNFKGSELKYGLSMDSYGAMGYSRDYYFWNTIGGKYATDRYHEGKFDSKTTSNLIFVEGGLSLSDNYQGWFGHNQLMWNYQHPVGKQKLAATWEGKPVDSEPWNKQSVRLVLESGIKNFGGKVRFEPLIKVGYGHEFGRQMSYYEYGGGFAFGVHKDWYREILKVTAFQRQDFKEVEGKPSGRFNVEVVVNATALVGLITK